MTSTLPLELTFGITVCIKVSDCFLFPQRFTGGQKTVSPSSHERRISLPLMTATSINRLGSLKTVTTQTDFQLSWYT